MSPEEHFKSKVARYMGWLGEDFGLDADSCAAVFGNLGHECLGFTVMQEIAPAVKGSKGGYGWAQWTGPRRKAFEAWCLKSNLRPETEAANYGFLAHELRTTEKAAIAAVKKAQGLENKVIAFERAYERAGVKSYNGRLRWAVLAQQAWRANLVKPAPAPVPAPAPALPPVPSVPAPVTSRTLWAWLRSFFNPKGTAL